MKSISFSITRQGADIFLTPAKHTHTLIFLHGLGDSAEGKNILFSFSIFSCKLMIFYFIFLSFFKMRKSYFFSLSFSKL